MQLRSLVVFQPWNSTGARSEPSCLSLLKLFFTSVLSRCSRTISRGRKNGRKSPYDLIGLLGIVVLNHKVCPELSAPRDRVPEQADMLIFNLWTCGSCPK